jgi:hypothetical protein
VRPEGTACCLLVAIDDASGRVFMRFAVSENAYDVMVPMKAYVQHHGIPREVYVDFGSVYHAKKKRLTDVARALARLGVSVIQITPSRAPLPPPTRHVTLRRWLDGSLHLFWNDHELTYKKLTARPTPKP